MSNMTVAVIFVVTLNLLMWFSSIAMIDVNPAGSVCYNVEGTIIGNYFNGAGNQSVLDNDVLAQLPAGQEITAGSSSIFTDIFNNILSWFKSTPGVKYVYGVVAAPFNILKCMGLPAEFTIGLGAFWYLITLLVLLAFMWGRE